MHSKHESWAEESIVSRKEIIIHEYIILTFYKIAFLKKKKFKRMYY